MARVTGPLSYGERIGMAGWLDNLESTLTAIRQRRMDDELLERYARLLAAATEDAIERGHVEQDRDTQVEGT